MVWVLFLGFVAFLVVAMLILLSPGKQAPVQKKKEKVPQAPAKPMAKEHKEVPLASEDKDWKAIAMRWEKNNTGLKNQLDEAHAQVRDVEKKMEALKVEVKEALSKLELEKSWRDKEVQSVEKLKQHEKDLKEQIFRTESDLEKEHSLRLRVEREHQDIKIKYEEVMEEKRQLSVKASSLETTLGVLQKTHHELQKENAKLKEKREDVQWVAKTSFDQVQHELREALRTIEDLKKGKENA